MFQVMRNGNDRIDVEMSGQLDSNEMRAALDELSQKSEGIAHGRLFCRAHDIHLPTLATMGIEVSRLPKMFTFVRRFERMAVVADQGWVRKTSEIEGALIPGLTIKAFDPKQVVEAERWLYQ
ncbi:STAS/SEC14 domain-containing protein [Pseudomonas sp. GD03944]|uniref:STAS/SEC14 domain-containing protein n=1 Tax=Pseudomonas sp. GD03944 TaxID=2975409 RepID=UPI00244B0A60|nr:STAS/SEC14 domain-containing protein [Pseudomonas sp. GD03944]MDH1261858.1 STAS/SEC14 domain-containing protein [Pseudomonas sp. GD03944]